MLSNPRGAVKLVRHCDCENASIFRRATLESRVVNREFRPVIHAPAASAQPLLETRPLALGT